MWLPSEDEAVELFARHFEALHRSGAVSKADGEALALQRAGDGRGHQIWQKVAQKVRQLRETERVTARRRAESA